MGTVVMLLFRLILVLFVLSILYFLFSKFLPITNSHQCAKCEGKGYWRATRGEKEKCDACMGTGKVPKGS